MNGVEGEWRSQQWEAGRRREARERRKIGIGRMRLGERMKAGGKDEGWGEG